MKKAKRNPDTQLNSDILQLKKADIPVVGLGASAGGLESFEQFFSTLPDKTGMAFVIITHLDSKRKSVLPDLLKKYTNIDVVAIENNLKIKKNTVYVLQPNTIVKIIKNTLYTMEKHGFSYLSLPINVFFDSLATDKKENAIAVILSGAGSDGSEGIKKIKRNGGMVIVQDPATSKYNSMPSNAIKTGLADYILPPNKISEQLMRWLNFGLLNNATISQELMQIFLMLRIQTGHDFSSYKLNTISRGIEKQILSHHLNSIADYVKFLRSNPREIHSLLKDLLIGVTSFFRDSEAFEILKKDILPKMLKNKPKDYTFRVWIPGCSTGEEVYSIAIIIREAMEETNRFCNLQIFGTDIDLNALKTARAGIYSVGKVSGIKAEWIKKYFNREKNSYKIKKEIRNYVIFGAQNIIKDPPFTRLDMICCRNLLIYLSSQLQKRLFALFHYSLKPQGILFLGTSESISASLDLFSLIVKKWKIFIKKDVPATTSLKFSLSNINPTLPEQTEIPNMNINHSLVAKPKKFEALKKYLNDHFDSCIVINKKGNIQYIHGKLKHSLECLFTFENKNLLKTLPLPLRNKLKTALNKINNKVKEINYDNIVVKQDGDELKFNLKVVEFKLPGFSSKFYAVNMTDIFSKQQKKITKKKYDTAAKMSQKILKLERELQYTKENLQTTIEELQSNNEELQSTNEEIETSKEELQSLNEELVVANAELQNQIDQLASVNDDINNLFNSTEIAVIFLDNNLRVKRFTPKAQELIPLIQSDIGRPLNHLASNIKYDDIVKDAKKVLKTLSEKSFEVESNDGRIFLTRIIPYKTLNNIIDGVIITFTNISSLKAAQAKIDGLEQQIKQFSKK